MARGTQEREWMMDDKWIPLTEPPEGDEYVILFKPDNDNVGLRVVASNPNYARITASKEGYTHWCRVPYPLPGTQKRKPAEVFHPGEHLQDEINGRMLYYSLKKTCERMDISIAKWVDLINGSIKITPEIAERLAGEFGTSAEYWMNLQREWDERDK